jgi:hypothetical protein
VDHLQALWSLGIQTVRVVVARCFLVLVPCVDVRVELLLLFFVVVVLSLVLLLVLLLPRVSHVPHDASS